MQPPQQLRRVCWRRASDPLVALRSRLLRYPGQARQRERRGGVVVGAGHGTGAWRWRGDCRRGCPIAREFAISGDRAAALHSDI